MVIIIIMIIIIVMFNFLDSSREYGDIPGGARSLSFHSSRKNQPLFLSTEALAAASPDESHTHVHARVRLHTHTTHV